MMKWFVLLVTIAAFLWDIEAGIYSLVFGAIWLLFWTYYKFVWNLIIKAFKNE